MWQVKMGNVDHFSIEIDEPFVDQVDADDLIAVMSQALDSSEHLDAELTLVITDDETIRQLNQRYRGVDAPTDVLSFSSQEQLEGVQAAFEPPPELAAMLNAHLGDIVIALPYAERQAQRFGNSVRAELRLLAVHGVLHLLGYDHDTDAAKAKMWTRQAEILRAYGDEVLARRVYTD